MDWEGTFCLSKIHTLDPAPQAARENAHKVLDHIGSGMAQLTAVSRT